MLENRRQQGRVAIARVLRRSHATRSSLLMALIVVAMLAVVAGAAAQTLDEDREDVEDRLEQAGDDLDATRAEESGLQEAIASNNNAIRETNARVIGLGGEVEELEAKAETARERLSAAQERLTAVTRQVRLARTASNQAQDHLEARVEEIYRSTAPDTFAVLFEARSILDLIDAVNFQRESVERDALLVDQVTRASDELKDARAQARTLRETRENRSQLTRERARSTRQARASLASERNALSRLLDEREGALAGIQVERAEFEAEVDALSAESERLESLIAEREAEQRRARKEAQAAAAASNPVLPVSSSGAGQVAPSASLIWPVNGLFVSPFGQRWGRLHAGIDISAPTGTTIVAASSGTVFFVGTYYGYGQFVLIDHGGGLVTAYAHLSSYAVANGQSISAGQPVGAVGCTGSCFGEHLHFEVRINGTPVDPLGYL